MARIESATHGGKVRAGVSFFFLSFARRPSNPRALHFWIGPLGWHLYWPPWASRVEWYRP